MSITLHIPEDIKINPIVTEADFLKLAIENQDLRLERSHTGELTIIPPTGGETGNKNLKIAAQLLIWSEQNQSGLAFDSSTGFRLPNRSIKSPDASWVSNQKWNSLTLEQQKKFPPICPDFAIELRSPTDNLKTLQDKMIEYLDNGLLLGWLIDPINKKVEIYRKEQEKEILDNPASISGEQVLLDFVLDLSRIL